MGANTSATSLMRILALTITSCVASASMSTFSRGRKQDQCWSASQVTFTTRMSVESFEKKKNPLQENGRTVQASRSPRLTVFIQSEKNHAKSQLNMLAPPDGTCTSLPSHPTLYCCSPSFLGDSTNAATVDVSQARTTTAQFTLKTQVQVHITATTRRPGKAQEKRFSATLQPKSQC